MPRYIVTRAHTDARHNVGPWTGNNYKEAVKAAKYYNWKYPDMNDFVVKPATTLRKSKG